MSSQYTDVLGEFLNMDTAILENPDYDLSENSLDSIEAFFNQDSRPTVLDDLETSLSSPIFNDTQPMYSSFGDEYNGNSLPDMPRLNNNTDTTCASPVNNNIVANNPTLNIQPNLMQSSTFNTDRNGPFATKPLVSGYQSAEIDLNSLSTVSTNKPNVKVVSNSIVPNIIVLQATTTSEMDEKKYMFNPNQVRYIIAPSSIQGGAESSFAMVGSLPVPTSEISGLGSPAGLSVCDQEVPSPSNSSSSQELGEYCLPESNTKKRKLYEAQPFSDPVKERERLNAIKAKKHRDGKKQLINTLNEKIQKLTEENQALKKFKYHHQEEPCLKEVMKKQQDENEALKRKNLELQHEIQKLIQNANQEQQDKLGVPDLFDLLNWG